MCYELSFCLRCQKKKAIDHAHARLHRLNPWKRASPILPLPLPWWSTSCPSPLQTACSLGGSPASPVSAAAPDTLSTVQMHVERAYCSFLSRLRSDNHGSGPGPYPRQGYSGANRFLFCFASWKCGWFCYVAPACGEICLPPFAFGKAGSCNELHKPPPASFCFAYLPCLLSQKDEQGEMISSGGPFLLSKVIWERICHITTLL